MSKNTISITLTDSQWAHLRHILWDKVDDYQTRQMSADEEWVENGWRLRACQAAILANAFEHACDPSHELWSTDDLPEEFH